MTTVAHRFDACTGEWAIGEDVLCPVCGALHEASPGNVKAAQDEAFAGIYLRLLASEGEGHLNHYRPEAA